MTPEPLDPCPVCGSEMVSLDTGTLIHGVGKVRMSCVYMAKPEDHRRLCAEVALARAVIEHDKKTAKACEHYPGTCELCDKVYDAIDRVQEASK